MAGSEKERRLKRGAPRVGAKDPSVLLREHAARRP